MAITEQKNPVSPDLQAGAFGTLIKFAKEVIKWASKKENWPTIGGGLAGAKEIYDTFFNPGSQKEYKLLSKADQESIDKHTKKLSKAVLEGSTAEVVSSLKAIANIYNANSKVVKGESQPLLHAKAVLINDTANQVASGNIKLNNPVINDNAKDLDKGSSQDPKTSSSQGLNQSLEKLMDKALTELTISKINSSNSQQVADKLLKMGASPAIAEQALSHYYEDTLGLAKSQSSDLASESVESAVKNGSGIDSSENQSKPVPSAQREM